jgi:hypothetical protein
MYRVPDHIENPGAYERAIEARIKANAAKTRRANWFAAHPDAERLNAWLNRYGEFKGRYACGNVWATGGCCDNSDRCLAIGEKEHPLVRGMFAGDFGGVLLQMRDAIMEWGGLTDKQTDLVRRALARAEERHAKAQQRREERLATDRNSQHIGTIGARLELTLRCEKVFSFEGFYGTTYINLCRDEANNVVVYKGSNAFQEGDTFRVKATIKAHEERDGVAQTLIARPKTL